MARLRAGELLCPPSGLEAPLERTEVETTLTRPADNLTVDGRAGRAAQLRPRLRSRETQLTMASIGVSSAPRYRARRHGRLPGSHPTWARRDTPVGRRPAEATGRRAWPASAPSCQRKSNDSMSARWPLGSDTVRRTRPPTKKPLRCRNLEALGSTRAPQPPDRLLSPSSDPGARSSLRRTTPPPMNTAGAVVRRQLTNTPKHRGVPLGSCANRNSQP